MFGNRVMKPMQGGGLLGQSSVGGLMGGGLMGGGSNTQELMRQYLMSLFMRRYQPPAIQQQPGMVSSQMGQGGMQYRAPQIPNVQLPGVQQPASQPSAGFYGPSAGANSYDPLAYLRHMSQFEGGG